MGTVKLKVGQLAGSAGLATSALRFYESEGPLGPGERTEAGYRLYGPEALGRLRFIQRAKALGLTLDEIRRLLDGPHADSHAERQALRHTVAQKIAETRSRTKQLQALDLELQSLYTRLLRDATTGCGHLGDCECWLPTDAEVREMTDEVASCGGAPLRDEQWRETSEGE